jgi:hypothetical protein
MIQLTFEFVHQFMYSWILSFKQINRKVISLQNTNTRTTHDTRHTNTTHTRDKPLFWIEDTGVQCIVLYRSWSTR